MLIRISILRPFVVALLALVAGCTSQTGPDSNVQVFETPEQAAVQRKKKLLIDWQEMAVRIANAERADIKTTKGEGFSLHLSADGVEQTVDLTPLTEKLNNATGKEREPIRAYLAEKIPEFDRARLAAIGFVRVVPMLYPQLQSSRQTPRDTEAAPITNQVVIGLNWVPVVRWSDSSAETAVDAKMAAAWKVSAEQVCTAAVENLKNDFAKRTQAPFDAIDLPGLGRYGSLHDDTDPAVILLPDFVAAVRKEWKSTDDLVLFMPSRHSINFIERKNERLLNRMIPEWAQLYAKVPDPMLSTMILAGDNGLSLFNYAPASTRPASAPATKPRVYIVQ
jgi:hypothetical protein